jgi:hypothetical protein
VVDVVSKLAHREDRELLAGLARLNWELAALAMRMMEGSASVSEQWDYARRLIAAGEWLWRRAGEPVGVVIDGEVLPEGSLTFSGLIGESCRES